ncbi:MAG: MipA/OmpV family protein [Alphaproteobacteria bacterium]|nr:MipA/OmpV family protein [Alphaproteobacteria bacterium]
MKIACTLIAFGAAAALVAPAAAVQKPRWEVGIGAAGTYQPAYYGANDYSAGGFPIVYFSYRGDDFSFLPNGLFDVASYDKSRFGVGVSFDVTGDIKSKDRLNLGKIDYVFEAGPELTVALLATGRSRIELNVAGRAAYEWNGDFEGWVLEPELAFLTTLTSTTRLGLSAAPKFGFGKYNDFFYSAPAAGTRPAFDAQEGYLGTAISLKLVNDVTDRLRISGEVTGIVVSGSKVEDSPLVEEDFNFAARIAVTYSLWQSDEMVDY